MPERACDTPVVGVESLAACGLRVPPIATFPPLGGRSMTQRTRVMSQRCGGPIEENAGMRDGPSTL